MINGFECFIMNQTRPSCELLRGTLPDIHYKIKNRHCSFCEETLACAQNYDPGYNINHTRNVMAKAHLFRKSHPFEAYWTDFIDFLQHLPYFLLSLLILYLIIYIIVTIFEYLYYFCRYIICYTKRKIQSCID